MRKGFVLAAALFAALSVSAPVQAQYMTKQQAYNYARYRNAQYQKQQAFENQITVRYRDALQAYSAGNYSGCINYLSNNYVAARYQTKKDYNIAMGDSYYKLGRYSQATPYLKRAYNMGANIALVNVGLGMSYYKLGDSQDAISYLQAASSSSLADGEVLWALADSYSKANNQSGMQAALEALVSRYPSYKKEAYSTLANTYFSQNNIQKGLSVALMGLKYFPKDGDILFWAGHGYFLKQDFENAISYLAQSNQVIPNNIDTLYDLGFSYLSKDDLDNAAACADRMAQLNKDHPKTQELQKAVAEKVAQKQMEQQMQMDMMNQAMQSAQDAADQGLQQGADAAMDNAAMENPAMQTPAGM